MNVELAVDVESAVPVYEQIRAQVAAFILTGTLRVGDRLPTIRALAADLGIAINTVARAYQELDTDGLIKRRRRAGTVVTAQPALPDLGMVREAARHLAAQARAAGVEQETVVALVREAMPPTTADDGVKRPERASALGATEPTGQVTLR